MYTSKPTLGAGFRYSSYGPAYNPGPEYWACVGEQMAAKFQNARPATIWIVGILDGEGTYLSFGCETDNPNIHCGYADINEQTLTLFDERGFDVWLQGEPGNADVDQLITDEEAKRWVTAVRKHNPNYQLFLKHWEKDWMPPTERDGIFFVDDSQQFESFDQMIGEFTDWGEAFEPAPVGFQYGYPADRIWWQNLPDPPKDIGQTLLNNVPNTEGLFWVDFTILDMFPPQ
jgi:hypothetical protein